MAIVNRFSRLFTADMHAVLDRLEEPDVLLKQAVREMEEEVAKTEQQLRLMVRDAENLRHRANETEAQIRDLNEQIDLCFNSHQETLAKSLIRRKLPAEKMAKVIETKIGQSQDAIRATNATLADQRQRLTEVREKAQYLCDQPVEACVTSTTITEPSISEEDVEIAFLREKQRRTNP